MWAIGVELDDEWFEVPAVFERLQGVSAQGWLAAVRQRRARDRHEASLDEDIVFDAVRHIDDINGNAMKRMGPLVGGTDPP